MKTVLMCLSLMALIAGCEENKLYTQSQMDSALSLIKKGNENTVAALASCTVAKNGWREAIELAETRSMLSFKNGWLKGVIRQQESMQNLGRTMGRKEAEVYFKVDSITFLSNSK